MLQSAAPAHGDTQTKSEETEKETIGYALLAFYAGGFLVSVLYMECLDRYHGVKDEFWVNMFNSALWFLFGGDD